jgi:hypothetical protein
MSSDVSAEKRVFGLSVDFCGGLFGLSADCLPEFQTHRDKQKLTM